LKENVMTQDSLQVTRKDSPAASGAVTTPSCNAGCSKNCCGERQEVFSPKSERAFTVALIGQPNTGKSTLFNAITGANQHVANWPGKTVEKKEGHFRLKGRLCHIYDLPGTYSLTANSVEEVIARDFVLRERPDVVVVVVDASQLERSLYMAAEAIPLGAPMVIALNKIDLAEKLGLQVDDRKLAQLTGIPTIPMDAAKRKGIDALLKSIAEPGNYGEHEYRRPDYGDAFGPAYSKLLQAVNGLSDHSDAAEWTTLKLLERDGDAADRLRSEIGDAEYAKIDGIVHTVENGRLLGPKARYDWIKHLVDRSSASNNAGKKIEQNAFDRFATHPLWGKGVALVILVLSGVAAYLVALPLMLPGFALFFLASPLRETLTPIVPPWLVSMLTDGIFEGVFMATIIIGFIGGVFLVLGVLESTGYLARLAYLFDPFMKRIGLHGKSLMPLLMGFICNILGVAGSRVIDSWRQRLVTLVVVPAVPCKALFMVIAFICAVFFGGRAIPIFAALLIVMLAYIAITSLFLRKMVVRGERTGLIMELPPYQKPNWKNVFSYALVRVRSFYRRGYWFIVGAALVIWVGIYFPGDSINTSYLARLGGYFAPLGELMGMDWRLFVSYLVAFTSKEATLGAMAVIFGATATESSNVISIAIDKTVWNVVHGDFGSFLGAAEVSEAGALAFIFAVFFSLPCYGTLGAIYAETRSYMWTFGILVYYLVGSILMGILAYHIGLMVL
jgi:ferrous iron transport protein B